jgi:hypothetical protein
MCHCNFIPQIDDAVEAGEQDHGCCIEITLVAQILSLVDVEIVQILKDRSGYPKKIVPMRSRSYRISSTSLTPRFPVHGGSISG